MDGASILPKYIEPLEQLPHFPIEELEREYLSNHKDRNQTFLDHLQTFYDIIASQEEYSRVIPVFDLVHIFKKYFAAGALVEMDDSNSIKDNIDLDNLEIEELQSKVLSAIKEKIFINYFAKGKFNREQAEAVFFALQDIVNDWCFNAGCQDTFHNYLKRHIEIDETTYFNKYKTKLEYLVKLAREEFISLLDSEL